MPTAVTVLITVFISILIAAAFLACLAEALFPRWFWKTFESWKASGEPTDAYFRGKRISGIVGMVIVAVIAAVAMAPTLIAYFDK